LIEHFAGFLVLAANFWFPFVYIWVRGTLRGFVMTVDGVRWKFLLPCDCQFGDYGVGGGDPMKNGR